MSTQSAGDILRDRAFAHLDASDGFDENGLLRQQYLKLARQHAVFSANDLPQWVRDRTDPNRRGKAFRELLDAGVLVDVGTVKSSNPRAHGKRVLTYRLAPTTSGPDAQNGGTPQVTSTAERKPSGPEAITNESSHT